MVEGDRLRHIPIGVEDFKELREDNYYFVDKSELISDILSDRSKVYLFTRPRRFGKSLNLSMIDAFFNMDYRGNTWFDGLRVSDHPEALVHRNAYPVIKICMKDIPVEDYDDFLLKVGSIVRMMYRQFSDLKKNDDVSDLTEIYFDRTHPLNRVELQESVQVLCRAVTTVYGVKPIVLIDEYDNPINSSFNRKDHDRILEFLRYFYSSTLKGNDSMSFAVVTGVMQIAKESIFSGLNNLSVNNIFSKKFDERYGFTESEVKELCAYYGHPERFVEAKEWYDGYRFGNADIYNPWSLLNYVDNGFDPKPYWAGTSGNDIIDTLIGNADHGTYGELQSLGEGKTITKSFPITVVLNNLNRDRNTVYAVMAIAGYLNAVPGGKNSYALSVPNTEMYMIFSEFISYHIHTSAFYAFGNLFDGMEKADIPMMKSGLDTILKENIPFILLSREKDYQLILAAAAMSCLGRYSVSLEEESGNGRADIIMRPNRPGLPNIIFELKRTKDGKVDLTGLADLAITQIEEKDYCRRMTGRVLMYGIAFCGKDSAIALREHNSVKS